MAYEVPIAAPQSPVGGANILSQGPPAGVSYDIGQEFPFDPFRYWIAWANTQWIVTSIYNGK